MSKLTRARKRLIELRNAADPGPWKVTNEQTWSEAEIEGFQGPIASAGDYASSNATVGKETAHLIVTLYTTIDAQIDILTRSIEQQAKYKAIGAEHKRLSQERGLAVTPRPAWKDLDKNRDAYALADAILAGA